MAKNKVKKFWKELKRRKVVRVIIIYATTAFILLQLVSILIEPLRLPDWTMTLIIVLLAIGFPRAVIFSWIFDVTPKGIEVTPAKDDKKAKETVGIFSKKNLVFDIIIGVLLVVVVILAYPKIFNGDGTGNINPELEKSIAVLPFRDDSPEEGNTYIINGLMEEILNKLEKIQDLNVKSRTAVEKYRDSKTDFNDIAKELNVNYILEGSGQKVGGRIKLMLQLIEAGSGNHLWSSPYIKEVSDENIFELQEDVAISVAEELKAIITPEEKERLTKKPTDNLTAWDYLLKGRKSRSKGKTDDLEEAITYFEKALEHDNKFALAFAELAKTYYALDDYNNYFNLRERRYSSQINNNADKALLYDPLSDWSLVAKAYYYLNEKEYEMAIPYLEKALEYNPNSSSTIRFLSIIYGYYLNNPEKRLEYALMAINIDIPLSDTVSVANKYYDYYFLSEAFRNNGFFKEAL